MPTVSVIMPVYNCESFIGEAIASVQAQTFKNLEVIVVNDGSTDSTLAIATALAKTDQRIKVISQKNSGKPSIARNVGIRASSGEFLCFLDADDKYLPEKMEKQLALFSKYPEVGVVFHDVKFIFGKHKLDDRSYLGRVDFLNVAKDYIKHAGDTTYLCGPNYYNFMSAFCSTVLVSGIMLRRSCLDRQTVWFPENMLIGEDIDLWFRLALVEKFGYLDEILSCYRQHDSSITQQTGRYLSGSIRVHRLNLQRGINILTRQERRRYEGKIRSLHWHYGYLLYSQYEMARARTEYLSALRLKFDIKALIALFKTMLPVSFIKMYKSRRNPAET